MSPGWLCLRRHGLPPNSHLTMFDWSDRDPVEMAAFHVTFEVVDARMHFYYREEAPAAWRLEGHTPTAEFTRLGADRVILQQTADAVAQRLVVALQARWLEEPSGSSGYRPDE